MVFEVGFVVIAGMCGVEELGEVMCNVLWSGKWTGKELICLVVA